MSQHLSVLLLCCLKKEKVRFMALPNIPLQFLPSSEKQCEAKEVNLKNAALAQMRVTIAEKEISR